MSWLAQVWVERMLNSLPEGVLLAVCSWLLLRLVGRQNSGTRFAVWFVALAGVAGLSLTSGLSFMDRRVYAPVSRVIPHLTVPAVWAEIAFAAWALIAFAALARIAAGFMQLAAIRRSCREIDLSALDPIITETFQQHGAGRAIRLAVSEQVKVPAAIGFRKPVIVLPAWTLEELKPSELKPILVHELTHLKRHDDWTNLLQKMARAIFFFHPAVWWIDSRLSLEREMACDDAVLASCDNPRAYAASLIDLLEKSCARRGWTMAQAAVHRARELSLRISQILDAKRPGSTRVWKPALALTSVFSMACFGLSYCAPQLVAFAPEHIDSTARVLHTDDSGTPNVRGAVVPVSFHIPVPTRHTLHEAAPKAVVKTQKHRRAVPLAARYEQTAAAASRAPMVRTTKLTTTKHSAPAGQVFVFVETSYIGYGETDGSQNPQVETPSVKTQVWQILLVAPMPNPAQMDGASSAI